MLIGSSEYKAYKKAYDKERVQQPEFKRQRNERNRNPESRATKATYDKKHRERNLERDRVYRKEYNARPEVKAMKSAYGKVRHQRPGIKERSAAQCLANSLRRKYGLTVSGREAMLAEQGGACVICRSSIWGKLGPHIDHDHKTGRVRGILCHHCNHMLGYARDNIVIMEAAIAYLKGANAKSDPNPSSGEVGRCDES
jgi:hypothetical protein